MKDKIKTLKFEEIMSEILPNIEGWNRYIKDKKYKIYKNDSDDLVRHKVYRYCNKFEEAKFKTDNISKEY